MHWSSNRRTFTFLSLISFFHLLGLSIDGGSRTLMWNLVFLSLKISIALGSRWLVKKLRSWSVRLKMHSIKTLSKLSWNLIINCLLKSISNMHVINGSLYLLNNWDSSFNYLILIDWHLGHGIRVVVVYWSRHRSCYNFHSSFWHWQWWLASFSLDLLDNLMDLVWRLTNKLLVSFSNFHDSWFAIKLLSHNFISIKECLQLSIKGGVLTSDNGNMLLQSLDLGS